MKFGKAFSDNVILERERRGLFSTAVPSWWFGSGRPLLFASCMFLAFFILFWRLFSLTVINGHTYRLLSDTNKTRQLILHAPRGELLDRTGKPLAFNSPYFRILKPCDTTPEKVCVSKISENEGKALMTTGIASTWFLEADYKREYTAPVSLFHAIGYVGEVSGTELQDEYYILRGYRMGDMIGRTGAEAEFEEELRGKDGKKFVEVDAQGAIIRTLGQTAEVKGSSLTLSLDKGLSEAAAQAFPKNEKGAVVVTKPSTGEILALYSSPSFSSETLSGSMSADEYEALTAHPDRPLFNRSLGGVYPPGSIFKLITAVAGLEENVITKNTVVEDSGEITIGLFTFPNWYFKQYGKTEGMVNVVKALQRSNDIFFYKTGEWLGITKLGVWAKKMGAGNLLGIDLPGEASGLVPDPQWKDAVFHTPEDLKARNNEWYLGDTYHVSIGQGYLLTTPLQVNTWTNVIANGGKVCKPTVRKMENARLPDGQGEWKMENCKDLGIKKETIELITEGMKEACSEGGTGWPLFNFSVSQRRIPSPPAGGSRGPLETGGDSSVAGLLRNDTKKMFIPVACKTGTAEYGDPKNKTHAWFTVFAPLPKENSNLQPQGRALNSQLDVISGEPEISVTVLMEGAGEGSDKAAPVAKKILEEWFSR
ncbi:MAG: penicillin-binding protein 2, penicillin-binding protein 2, partial [Microgenomates group bacterium GW2011_GWC1_43_11]